MIDWITDHFDHVDDDEFPPEAFMEGICGGAGMYTCLCAGDFCACGIETIICEGCIDCVEN